VGTPSGLPSRIPAGQAQVAAVRHSNGPKTSERQEDCRQRPRVSQCLMTQRPQAWYTPEDSAVVGQHPLALLSSPRVPETRGRSEDECPLHCHRCNKSFYLHSPSFRATQYGVQGGYLRDKHSVHCLVAAEAVIMFELLPCLQMLVGWILLPSVSLRVPNAVFNCAVSCLFGCG
jgi:hypothetical protein